MKFGDTDPKYDRDARDRAVKKIEFCVKLILKYKGLIDYIESVYGADESTIEDIENSKYSIRELQEQLKEVFDEYDIFEEV